MPQDNDRAQYRAVIDDLVRECREGQGRIHSEGVRSGIFHWYAADHPDEMPDESRINGLLARMEPGDREVVAVRGSAVPRLHRPLEPRLGLANLMPTRDIRAVA